MTSQEKTPRKLTHEEEMEKKASLELLKQKKEEQEYESANKISPDIATEEQLVKEKEEYHAEKDLSIQSIRDKSDIERITKEVTFAAKIPTILDNKPDGGEKYVDTRKSQEKQHSGFKTFATKFMAMLGFVALGDKATAGSAEEIFSNPNRTTVERSISLKESTGMTGVLFTKDTIPEKNNEVSNALRQDYNDYIDWLDSLDLRGNPALDKNGLGNAMIVRYQKEHPETSISLEAIGKIQGEFEKYRQWVIERVKEGTAEFAPGVTEKNFLAHLSKVDYWAGSKTTTFKFPPEFINKIDKTALDYATIGNKAVNSKDNLEGRINNVTVKEGRLVETEKKFSTRDQ